MSMLGLKIKLGLFPNTEKIEKKRDALFEEYQKFLAYSKSKELERYEYLSKYLNSPEFEEKENNVNIDRSEIEAVKKEFETLKKSRDLIWYFKAKAKESQYTPIKTWKVEFEDHFADNHINGTQWANRYFWNNKLLTDGYSLGEQNYVTDGKNVSVAHSILTIETRREKVAGKMWNPSLGFVPFDFPYTSGVVHTGNAFRHQYGKVEAKIQVPKSGVTHTFWLAGENMVPQINIFKYVDGYFYMGNYWGDLKKPNGIQKDNTPISGAFAGKYYIFTLEWTPKLLTWSINGVVFKTVQHGVPTEPMYIAFGSGISANADVASLPNSVKMEIDWVRFSSKA